MKILTGQAILFTCLVIMIGCLIFEGFVLGFEGFSSPLMRILGLVWLLTVVSCLVFPLWPGPSIAGGGGILLINSMILWRTDPETHQLDWFLYMHSVELLFLVASCVGAFGKWKSQAVQVQRQH